MKVTSLLIFFCLLLNVSAQKKQASIESSILRIEFNNPYKFNSEIKEALQKDTNPWKRQTALLSYQKKGDYKKTLELFDLESNHQESNTLTQSMIDSIKTTYTPLDAKAYITEQAKSNQIVIINEAHHNPSHRIFTRSLLEKLYESGYTYLGIEALYNGPKGGTPIGNNAGRIKDEKDSLLMTRKYPVFQSGNYLEPQMGNLIRSAIEIGFTVFSYEKTGVGSGNPRELGQAKNIQKILDKDPNAKILIHCGFSHAYEGTDVYESGGKAMAGWLKELTGIDPLTVNQSTYSENYSIPELNNPLLYIFSFNTPKVLVDDNGKPMKFVQGNMYTDIVIINPVTEYINGRPSWLFTNGRESINLNLPNIDISYPLMAIAYKRGEDILNAIPVDLVEVKNSEAELNLALAKGAYTIVLYSKKEKAIKFDISVK